MSRRTPFGRPKEKPPGYEEAPVIAGRDAPPQDLDEDIEPVPTQGKVVPLDDTDDLFLRLQKPTDNIITNETVSHAGELEPWLRAVRRSEGELPVIYGPEAIKAEIPPEVTPTVSRVEITDRMKLKPGETSSWREAVKPARNQKRPE